MKNDNALINLLESNIKCHIVTHCDSVIFKGLYIEPQEFIVFLWFYI